jgi:hypothetical protein
MVINMAIVGQWNLHYDFGFKGSYALVEMTFNNNNTFNIPTQNFTRKWMQSDG